MTSAEEHELRVIIIDEVYKARLNMIDDIKVNVSNHELVNGLIFHKTLESLHEKVITRYKEQLSNQ